MEAIIREPFQASVSTKMQSGMKSSFNRTARLSGRSGFRYINVKNNFHLLFLDGVYAEDADGKQRFHRVKAPSHCDLNTLVHTLSHHIARCLEKRGRDAENT